MRQVKNEKHMTAARCCANRPEKALACRVRSLWPNKNRALKEALDLSGRNAMLLALVPVPAVPIEAIKIRAPPSIVDICIYDCQRTSPTAR